MRHMLVDNEGFSIRVLVHPAIEQDKAIVKWVLRLIPVSSRWQKVIVDAGYNSPMVTHHCQELNSVALKLFNEQGKGLKCGQSAKS